MTDDWIEFDSTIRTIGNKGKSRGINLSASTNELDIGRHIIGKFRFVDDAPDSIDYLERKKQAFLHKRIAMIQETKTFCAQNKLTFYARREGIKEEDALSLTNLNYYLEVWDKLDIQTFQVKLETNQEPQILLYETLKKQLEKVSIDVHAPYTLRGKEGVRETYSKTEYALDEVLERVVHKDNIEAYKKVKAEFLKAKEAISTNTNQEDGRNDYLLSLKHIPNFVLEAVVDDIDSGYTRNALAQLDKRVDAYIKNPIAILRRKSK